MSIAGLFITVITSLHSLIAGQTPDLKTEIVTAIEELAHHIFTVNMDENGQCRGHYKLLDGKWYPYEPAWHTGQFIFALTRVYEITKKPVSSTAAKKAGDWWVSLEIKDHPRLKGMVPAIHGAAVNYIVFATVTDGSADRYSISGSTTAFAGILWLRLLQYGVGEEFKPNIERSLDWILQNRYPKVNPDRTLAGGAFEIRSKVKKGKLYIFNRDIADAFAVRFLADYYEYAF